MADYVHALPRDQVDVWVPLKPRLVNLPPNIAAKPLQTTQLRSKLRSEADKSVVRLDALSVGYATTIGQSTKKTKGLLSVASNRATK